MQTQSISGVACRFHHDHAVAFKDHTAATHLFHVAREALNNAVRHSGADGITIALTQENGNIRLTVSDDGKGIGADSPATGIGLQIMRYRARMIGASFGIKSDHNTGTTIQVVVKHPT